MYKIITHLQRQIAITFVSRNDCRVPDVSHLNAQFQVASVCVRAWVWVWVCVFVWARDSERESVWNAWGFDFHHSILSGEHVWYQCVCVHFGVNVRARERALNGESVRVCACVYLCVCERRMERTRGKNVCVCGMGWLRLVGSLKWWVSHAKESYKRDYILQQRPIIWRSLLIEATPQNACHLTL